MPRIYDKNDYFFSYDGDYEFSETGDIMDTRFDMLRSIHQEILDRVRSDKGDWKYNKSIGASLSNFVGMPNNIQIANAIEQAIISAVQYNELVDINDINIKLAPISATVIAAQIKLIYTNTKANANSLPVTLTFLYDYNDNNVYPIYNNYNTE